jgi:hypothetical protein
MTSELLLRTAVARGHVQTPTCSSVWESTAIRDISFLVENTFLLTLLIQVSAPCYQRTSGHWPTNQATLSLTTIWRSLVCETSTLLEC